jgi:lysophospholipase L1-like esterase
MAVSEISNWTKFGYLLSAVGVGLGVYAAVRRDPAKDNGLLPAPPRLLDPGDSLLLLGDSIGVGIQHPLNDLSVAYGTVMTSHTKVGTTITYWSQRVDDSWGAYKVVLLSLGSNDAVSRPEAQEAALANLLEHLRVYGADVLWLRPPSFIPGLLKPGQLAVEKLFADAGVPALELHGPRVSVAGDPQKLHPSPKGYATLAAQAFDALTRGV